MGNNIPYINEILPIIVSIASPDQIILLVLTHGGTIR